MHFFSIAHMYMCLGLITWHWITYQGLMPGKDYTPYLNNQLPFPINLRDLLCPLWHIHWCYYCSSLVCTAILLRFHECRFPVMFRRGNLAEVFLVLWLLQSLCPPFCDFLWAFGESMLCLCCGCINCSWILLHYQLFLAFWSVMVFCFTLLQREAYLLKGECYTCLEIEG